MLVAFNFHQCGIVDSRQKVQGNKVSGARENLNDFLRRVSLLTRLCLRCPREHDEVKAQLRNDIKKANQ